MKKNILREAFVQQTILLNVVSGIIKLNNTFFVQKPLLETLAETSAKILAET